MAKNPNDTQGMKTVSWNEPLTTGINVKKDQTRESVLKQKLDQLHTDCDRAHMEHQKERQRLHTKIVELEERTKDYVKDKIDLQSELMTAQKECRQALQRETALRSALQKADANSKHVSDKGQKYVDLQRKLDNLERVHAEGKRKHELDVQTFQQELDESRKTSKRYEARIIEQEVKEGALKSVVERLKQAEEEKDAEIKALQRKLRLSEESVQSLKEEKATNAEILTKKIQQSTLAARLEDDKSRQVIRDLEKAVDSERARHNTIKRKLDELQASYDSLQRRSSADGQRADRKLEDQRRRIESLEEVNQQLRKGSESERQELQDVVEHLSRTQQALQLLTREYGELKISSVDRRSFEKKRKESIRHQLAAEKLLRKLEDRDTQVQELVQMVRYAQEARNLLKAGLQERENEIQRLIIERDEVMAERHTILARWADDHASLRSLYDACVRLVEIRLQDSTCLQELDAARLGTLSELYNAQSAEFNILRSAALQLQQESTVARDAFERKLAIAEASGAKLKAEVESVSTLHRNASERLKETEAELEMARGTINALGTKMEKIEDALRKDVQIAQNALAAAVESEKEKDRLLVQSRMCEDGLRADIQGLLEQLETAARYEEAYQSLMNEVGVLVSRNELAEVEANRLSQLNAEILSHTNPNQKILYVDKIRRELAETKQALITMTCERDAALDTNATLKTELGTYKSVAVPIGSKPKTNMIRVQRLPLSASDRINVMSGSRAFP
ncbi:hypothetical protein FRB99_008779 [Tulasnella sp. 403]|nr:hypothetical protein FRB99_008779 [Tulasnella sp. 403]